jgi:hypothetical protein
MEALVAELEHTKPLLMCLRLEGQEIRQTPAQAKEIMVVRHLLILLLIQTEVVAVVRQLQVLAPHQWQMVLVVQANHLLYLELLLLHLMLAAEAVVVLLPALLVALEVVLVAAGLMQAVRTQVVEAVVLMEQAAQAAPALSS